MVLVVQKLRVVLQMVAVDQVVKVDQTLISLEM
jgi:hypothetical protein